MHVPPEVLDNELAVDGYSLVWRDRDRHGRGVAIIIHNSLPFKPLHLEHISHAEREIVAIECSLNSRIVTIVGFYRPPNSNVEVMMKLHNCLATLRPQNSSFVVILTSTHARHSPNMYLTVLETDFQLTQIVIEPTRVTDYSASMITSCFVQH